MSNMWAWANDQKEVSYPQTPWALDLNMADFPYPRNFHGPWYWEPMQSFLAEQGFISIAVDLQAASRYRCGTASDILADLEKEKGANSSSLAAEVAAVLVSHSQRLELDGPCAVGAFQHR